jgi:hypothetical protein
LKSHPFSRGEKGFEDRGTKGKGIEDRGTKGRTEDRGVLVRGIKKPKMTPRL